MAGQLTEAEVTAARDYLERQPEVELAYLFGSHAEGRAAPGSDVDIGLVTRAPLGHRRRYAMQYDLQELLGRDVDLVDMESMPIEFRCAIIGRQRRIVERSLEARVDFEARTMSLYADAEPRLRWQRKRILEGPRRERREQRARSLAELHRRTARAIDESLAASTRRVRAERDAAAGGGASPGDDGSGVR